MFGCIWRLQASYEVLSVWAVTFKKIWWDDKSKYYRWIDHALCEYVTWAQESPSFEDIYLKIDRFDPNSPGGDGPRGGDNGVDTGVVTNPDGTTDPMDPDPPLTPGHGDTDRDGEWSDHDHDH
jgi:hypothetical protein